MDAISTLIFSAALVIGSALPAAADAGCSGQREVVLCPVRIGRSPAAVALEVTEGADDDPTLIDHGAALSGRVGWQSEGTGGEFRVGAAATVARDGSIDDDDSLRVRRRVRLYSPLPPPPPGID